MSTGFRFANRFDLDFEGYGPGLRKDKFKDNQLPQLLNDNLLHLLYLDILDDQDLPSGRLTGTRTTLLCAYGQPLGTMTRMLLITFFLEDMPRVPVLRRRLEIKPYAVVDAFSKAPDDPPSWHDRKIGWRTNRPENPPYYGHHSLTLEPLVKLNSTGGLAYAHTIATLHYGTGLAIFQLDGIGIDVVLNYVTHSQFKALTALISRNTFEHGIISPRVYPTDLKHFPEAI